MAETVRDEHDDTAISLYNVLTDERWELLPNRPYRANFAWNQTEDEPFIELTYPTSTAVGAPGPLLVRISVPDGKISEWPPRPWGELSHDGHSLVRIIGKTGSPVQAALVNPYELGQEVVDGLPLTDPFDGRYGSHASARWSPDDTYFAVLWVAFPENRDGIPVYGLAVYTADGQLFRTYDGVNGSDWAPTEPPSLLHYIRTSYEQRIPCVLDVISGQNRCFHWLENWQDERGVKVYQFSWSPDGSKISFVTYPDPALCYVELATEDVSCLVGATDLIMNDVQFYIVGHHWSTDGRHLSISINPQGPGSDDASDNYLALVTAGGEGFRILGETVFQSLYASPWRPILTDPQ